MFPDDWLRVFEVETRTMNIDRNQQINLSLPGFQLVKMFMNTSSAHLDWKMMLRLSGLCFLIAVLTFTQILQSKQLVWCIQLPGSSTPLKTQVHKPLSWQPQKVGIANPITLLKCSWMIPFTSQEFCEVTGKLFLTGTTSRISWNLPSWSGRKTLLSQKYSWPGKV